MHKYLYWITTGLLAALYLSGGAMYLTMTDMVNEAWTGLGFPTYLVMIMGPIKIAAAILILWRPTSWIIDLVYFGMLFHVLLAISAHIHVADGEYIPALFAFVLLLVSFTTQNKIRKVKSPTLASVKTA